MIFAEKPLLKATFVYIEKRRRSGRIAAESPNSGIFSQKVEEMATLDLTVTLIQIQPILVFLKEYVT